jgi:hypothetical protein
VTKQITTQPGRTQEDKEGNRDEEALQSSGTTALRADNPEQDRIVGEQSLQETRLLSSLENQKKNNKYSAAADNCIEERRTVKRYQNLHAKLTIL